jgi:hypothetical protein
MSWHHRVGVQVLLGVLVVLASQQTEAQSLFENGFEGSANRTTPLGNNLDGVTDYASSYNFVDVMKQSRSWITQNTQGGIFDTEDADCLDLDANGYVQSMTPLSGCASPNYNAVATLFFFGDLNGHYPSGRYIVTYEGQGTISYHFAATKNLALSTPGRDVLDVNAANGGWMMRIDAITAGNHPRNMHVWMPGFDETTGPAQRFHPDFLALIEHNRVLRFMDWMGTNGSAAEHFVDRPEIDDVRWTDGHMPIEVMVDLANRVNADPWFNMPHRATDDYMAQFATQVKSLLRADRKVYVEYSNEVWMDSSARATTLKRRAWRPLVHKARALIGGSTGMACGRRRCAICGNPLGARRQTAWSACLAHKLPMPTRRRRPPIARCGRQGGPALPMHWMRSLSRPTLVATSAAPNTRAWCKAGPSTICLPNSTVADSSAAARVAGPLPKPQAGSPVIAARQTRARCH